MNKTYIKVIMFLTLMSFSKVQAQEMSFDEAHKTGDNFAKELHEQSKSATSNFEEMKTLPQFTENPKEAHLSLGDLNKETLKEKAAKDEAGKIIIESNRERSRDFEDLDKEKWFKDSMEIINEADKKNDKDCSKGKTKEITKIEFDKEIKKIKRKEAYLVKEYCEKSGTVRYKCDRKLSLTCNRTTGCDAGGIVPGTVQSDMKWEYVYPTLTLGTISDNYWHGRCLVVDRNTKFQVKNLDKITEFRIVEVGFDDYLWIKVNGHSVYVGPDGGDRLELVRLGVFIQVTTNGQNRMGCERGTNWNTAVNIDLKPYLREGENDIWMRVIVSGDGEGWMRIHARQDCCSDWVSNWDKRCENELKNY